MAISSPSVQFAHRKTRVMEMIPLSTTYSYVLSFKASSIVEMDRYVIFFSSSNCLTHENQIVDTFTVDVKEKETLK